MRICWNGGGEGVSRAESFRRGARAARSARQAILQERTARAGAVLTALIRFARSA
jgi:hypothetical protein